ncbi:unnamed protein product [Arctia plantaginis]|uniref:Uncharacterized protein n=1 Tax=Arctia plantaginis TaxID=874455 RepID=A0A8S0ZY63_ARCPL|nr:unnamed protein product [Arctia plantaginis]
MALNVANFCKNVRHASRHFKSVGTLINQHIREEPRLALRINTGPRKINKKKDPLKKLAQEPVKLLIHNTVSLGQAKGNKIVPRCPNAPDHLKRGPTTPCYPCKTQSKSSRSSEDICAAYFPGGARKKPCVCSNPCGPKKDPCPKSNPCGPRKDPCGPRKDPCGPRKNPCAPAPKKKCVPDLCAPKKCEPCPTPPPKKIVCDPCKPPKKGPCG